MPIRPGAGSAYEKVERRVGDWAVAAAGAVLELDGRRDRVIASGIGLTAVGAEHLSAAGPRSSCAASPADEAASPGAPLAAEGLPPGADQRGPADYKRHLAGELTARALRQADAPEPVAR